VLGTNGPIAHAGKGLPLAELPEGELAALDGRTAIETNVSLPVDEGAGPSSDPLPTRPVQSRVVVPLFKGGHHLGWLAVETTETPRRWSDSEVELVERVGELLGAAAARQRFVDGLSRLAVAVEQSPASVVITDVEGVIEYVNPKFSEVTGYTAREAIGSTSRMLGSDSTPSELVADLGQTIAAGSEWRGELETATKDGSTLWQSVSISPIRSSTGSVSHFIGVLEDITERQKALAELDVARQEAETATRAMSEFLANISHEIRTPINAIVGNAHLLLQSSELGERQRDHVDKIRWSAQELLGVINNILDLVEIDAGRVSIEAVTFSMESLVTGVSDLMRGKARDKGLELNVSVADEVPGSVIGDKLRLEQILLHLANNAVKFTDTGQVRISASTTRVEGATTWLQFAVADTGVGIPRHCVESLFAPFSQGDASSTREYRGAGLGLAIASRLAGLMGGEIRVDSEEGRGSEFTLEVPLASETTLPSRPLPSPTDLHGMRVLVVDDSRSDQRVLCEALSSFSFSPCAVASGEAGLEQLRSARTDPGSAPFELVLLDWKMPAMDGVETARRIKEDPAIDPKPAVILITGHGREDVLLNADHGVLDGYLLKPVDPSLLFDAIMAALGRHADSSGDSGNAFPARHRDRQILGAHVLLVEDNILNQEVARELIVDMGVSVTVAADGLEAVEVAAAGNYDLILMDIQMPVMDGYRSTMEIRKKPHLRDVPIVAMTAHAMSSDRDRCLAAGMDDYLSKPIDTDRLYKVLSRWIGSTPGRGPLVDPFASNKDEGPPLPSDLPGIDTDTALRRLGGNRRLLRKLLIEFLQDYRGFIDTLGTALDLGHADSVLRLVHTLKGTAATIGSHSVQIAAGELESAVSHGSTMRYDPLVAHLESVLTPVLAGLSAVRKEPSTEHPQVAATHGPVDLAATGLLVVELRELLRLADPEAAEGLEPLARGLAGAGVDTELEALHTQIERYDFDEALTTLASIVARLSIEDHAA